MAVPANTNSISTTIRKLEVKLARQTLTVAETKDHIAALRSLIEHAAAK